MMTKGTSAGFGWDTPIERPEGVTVAERSLKKLCDRSFLSLRGRGSVAGGRVAGGRAWPGVARGRGSRVAGRGRGRVDLGGHPPRSPTDPDVRVKRIWLFIS
jgi:hypothetical protein